MAMYEGAGNLFWFDAKAPNVWKATSLGGSAVSLAQLIAARTLFTRDQLIASNPDNENCNRFASPASPNKGMCFGPWSWFLVDGSLILVSCFLLYGWMWDLSRIRCFLNARGSSWEPLGYIFEAWGSIWGALGVVLGSPGVHFGGSGTDLGGLRLTLARLEGKRG